MHPTRRKALAEYSAALLAMRAADTAKAKRDAIAQYTQAKKGEQGHVDRFRS